MKKAKSRKAKPSKLVKPLTKEQLVKLYEEYHATKWDEYNNRLNQWLKDKHFKLVSILLGNQTLLFTRGFIEKSIRESANNEPKWIEPTFNEFMESLGEKKDLMDEWENANAEWEKGMVKLMNKQLFGSCQN